MNCHSPGCTIEISPLNQSGYCHWHRTEAEAMKRKAVRVPCKHPRCPELSKQRLRSGLCRSHAKLLAGRRQGK